MPRQAPALPAQALPPDKRKKEIPPPFEDMLPSGLTVKWRMPDPFTIISFSEVIPDPITAGVIALLRDERSVGDDATPLKFRYDAQSIQGMYGIVAAMLVEPRLDLSLEYGENGTLGRREIGLLDVTSMYWKFRIRTRQSPIEPADTANAEQPADAPSDSDGVRDNASGTSGSN